MRGLMEISDHTLFWYSLNSHSGRLRMVQGMKPNEWLCNGKQMGLSPFPFNSVESHLTYSIYESWHNDYMSRNYTQGINKCSFFFVADKNTPIVPWCGCLFALCERSVIRGRCVKIVVIKMLNSAHVYNLNWSRVYCAMS